MLAHESITGTSGLLQPVAVVDPSKENVAFAKKTYKLEFNHYETIADMLKAEQLDGIIISSPNNLHLENFKEIANLSLPILLEKPLDVSWESISELVRLAENYKGPIVVGHCMRYAPILNKAKELINSGAIGKICSTRFVQFCHYGNNMFHDMWRRNMEKSGGMFIEKATHDIDIMNWLIEAQPTSIFAVSRQQAFGGSKPNDLRCRDCDERLSCPESVQNMLYRWGANVINEAIRLSEKDACVYAKEATVNDNETCILQFDNGCFGTYTHVYFSPRSYHHRIYEVIGTEGIMEVDLGAEHGGKITLCKRFGSIEDKQEYAFDYMERNHYNGDGSLMQHFYKVIIGEEKPHSTVRQAYIAEAAGIAAIRSSEENRNVTLEEVLPDNLKYILKENIFIN